MVGIDEAGRGSVLGPMVYGMAYWNGADDAAIPKDFQDSKQLTESKRSQLFQTILQTPSMGWGVRVLPASEISRNMLRPEPYNLNQMSHDAAIQLIRQLQADMTEENSHGLFIDTCFIDTVGNPESYTRRLEAEFPGIQFVVESKADAKYAVCSAASVVAKVMRDALLENWKFSEPQLQKEQQQQQDDDDEDKGATTMALSTSFGSGYPSDPICKKWMDDNLRCKVFGYPDIVRFSWGPAKKALQKDAYDVTFLADEEDDENGGEFVLKKRQQEQMNIFLCKASAAPRKRKRYPFFEKRGLEIVTQLD